jgi:hypothetical protein
MDRKNFEQIHRLETHMIEVQILMRDATAVLAALLLAGLFIENSPHRFGRGRKEMTSMIPFLIASLADQPNVSLVNERGRLKRLSGLLPGDLSRRQFSQFLIDQR